MKFRNLIAAATAITLTASPVLAQSVSAELGRTAAPISGESKLEGDSTILVILALIAAGVGIALAAGSDSNSPASP